MRWKQRYCIMTTILFLILVLLYSLEENIRLRHILHSVDHPSKKDVPPLSAFTYLKHLQGKSDRLGPSFQYPVKGIKHLRTNISLIIGVPTVRRKKQSYLIATIESLVKNLNVEDVPQVLIIIFIAEPFDIEYVHETAKQVKMSFKKYVDSGLIEILSPPKDFYPDLSEIESNLKDTREQIVWRTKQNYDYAYLMMYSSSRGQYYLQLEDDVEAQANYTQAISKFIEERSKPNWFMLEFSTLGFIGKLFHTGDLHALANFFLIFSADMPIDWLLEHYQTSKYCALRDDMKTCTSIKKRYRFRTRPALFQHKGLYSSLQGKMQKLKERDFGRKSKVSATSQNPEVLVIESSLREYSLHTIVSCYDGEDFFWALKPVQDDTIEFKYDPPISIARVYFESGNTQHPQDKFYNTTVDIKPDIQPEKVVTAEENFDGFYTVANFSHTSGIAEALIDPAFGPISSIRLKVHSKSNTRVLLNEIIIEPVKTTTSER